VSLDEAAEQLYRSSLEDFVGERTRLVKELRPAGKPGDAETLARSRKPTVAAWVLNQLARRNRRDVDLLLDAGHRLREAQAGVLGGGDGEAFARAQKAQSKVLRRLRGEAERLLEKTRGGASASVANQVEQALRASAVSEAGREALARGRFVEPPRAEGFEVVSQLASSSSMGKTVARKGTTQSEQREATATLKEARARLRAAERTAAQLRRETKGLSRDAERARGGTGDSTRRAHTGFERAPSLPNLARISHARTCGAGCKDVLGRKVRYAGLS
jgi:hypothetical protein